MQCSALICLIHIFSLWEKYILRDNCPKDTTDASLLSVYSQHELCQNYNHYKVNAVVASTCFLTDILTQIFILNLLSSIEQLLSALHTRHGIHVLTPVSHFLFLQGDSTVSAVKFILRWGYMLFNSKHCRYVFIFIALNLSA